MSCSLPVWCPGSVSVSRLLEVVLLLDDALQRNITNFKVFLARQYKSFEINVLKIKLWRESDLCSDSSVGFVRDRSFLSATDGIKL